MTAELRDRFAIAIFLIPLAMWFLAHGGWLFMFGALGLFGLAAAEYAHMFRTAGHRPALPVLLGGVLLLLLSAEWPWFEQTGLSVGLSVVTAWVWHMADFERGAATAATDLTITLGGIFLLGGLGRYFVLMRALPEGLWWVLATFGAVWMADTGAYLAGKQWGKERLAPRLSPKKTWQGYAGGIVVGAFSNAVFCAAWQFALGPASRLTWWSGLLLGVLIGALSPLGDLGVSLFKRQLGIKDSSALLGSHGGVLDRIDSWLIAGMVGYYFALVLQTSAR
jgi:phosphatidate cytidylyltransferase